MSLDGKQDKNLSIEIPKLDEPAKPEQRDAPDNSMRSQTPSAVRHETPVNSNVAAAGTPASQTPRDGRFECDYDKNPTTLFLDLQRKEWDKAATNTSDIQARTWVSRKEKHGKLRWRLLPLHAAIIFKAPEKVVENLLASYPKGAQSKDDQGMLPLHLAFRHGSSEATVNLLLVAFPQSVEIKDRKGRIPLVLAQASASANRDAFVRALERGPTYYANAAAATERAAVTAEQRAIFGAKLTDVEKKHQQDVNILKEERKGLNETVELLQKELGKQKGATQVLVDHVNSLETQLRSKGETERFLAVKAATLDTNLKEISEENEMTLQALNAEVEKRAAEVGERTAQLQAATEAVQQREIALEQRTAELNLYKAGLQQRAEEVEDIKTMSAAEIQDFKQMGTAEIGDLKIKVDQLKKEKAAEVEELRRNNDAEVEELKKEHAAELEGLKKANAFVIEELRREKAADIGELKVVYASQFDELTMEKASAFEEFKREAEAEIEELKKENDRLDEDNKLMSTGELNPDEFKYVKDKCQKQERELKSLKMDWASAQARAAVLEAQLKSKIENEHELASQVSHLAGKLAESAADSTTYSDMHSKRIELLEDERERLRTTVNDLGKKLLKVSHFMNKMTQKSQESNKKSTEDAKHKQAKLLAEASTKEELIRTALAERKHMADLLKKQEEEMERSAKQHQEILDKLAELKKENTPVEDGLEDDATIPFSNSLTEEMHEMMNNVLMGMPQSVPSTESDLVDSVIASVAPSSVNSSSASTASDERMMERMMAREVRLGKVSIYQQSLGSQSSSDADEDPQKCLEDALRALELSRTKSATEHHQHISVMSSEVSDATSLNFNPSDEESGAYQRGARQGAYGDE